MARAAVGHLVMAVVSVGLLTACEAGKNPFAPKPKPEVAATGSGESPAATSVKLVDRDVEAPEIFQTTDTALWDGRPSLGGVWVASPDAKDPERVILRNPANGKFVIGALFRRERDNPGPKLQISSDAAAALGLLAGQPGKINVTALRRDEAPTQTDASKPILDAAETVAAEQPAAPAPVAGAKPIAGAPVTAQPLDKPAAAAAAPAAKPAAPAAKAAPKGKTTTIQIGIFSVEANAKRAADALGKAGVSASIKPGQTQGKAHWSVTASGSGDRTALLNKVKGLGFADAYLLSK
ncbi:sporulation related protein [Gemmobacter caeni]|jgi:hypothetical protein|uniref:Sporulation related protein n=1 Tax=Gemmobacter caeni TaxID=589035 RepID=A0A2T6BBL2_9RHOB|nr:SPOR domain-containing protein [Gemmobacter caeni]PTX53459.1 sporulation related protein [Gemmobacter caeni]TWJ05570.1 sporulation related protein [Gemmobacter caeni]